MRNVATTIGSHQQAGRLARACALAISAALVILEAQANGHSEASSQSTDWRSHWHPPISVGAKGSGAAFALAKDPAKFVRTDTGYEFEIWLQHAFSRGLVKDHGSHSSFVRLQVECPPQPSATSVVWIGKTTVKGFVARKYRTLDDDTVVNGVTREDIEREITAEHMRRIPTPSGLCRAGDIS